MKIQFIHLSDLHIRNNSQINLKIDKLVSAIQGIGAVDKCILICSGDLAFSGNKNEYYQVKSFIGALLSKLGESKNQLIDFLLVPGNHDILLPSTRNIDEILQHYEKGNENNAFEDELKLQNNFFIYANFKKCFRKNKIIDLHITEINGYKIQFNLINTAPFSTFKKDNKEIHYLPDPFLYSLIKKIM